MYIIKKCKYCNSIIANKRTKYFCCREHHHLYDKQLTEQKRKYTHCTICGKELGWHQDRYCSKSHARIGKKPFLGKKHKSETLEKISTTKIGHQVSIEAREKLRKINLGKKQTIETRKKRSKSLKGHPNYLKSQSEEAKKKIGLSSRLRIKEQLEKYGIIPLPNFNIKACEYFKKFDEEHNTKGRYALYGGGEYYIKELGYWVDYFNPDLKLIMEYDEPRHYLTDGSLRLRDITRQTEIQSLFSEFQFLRVRAENND